eukprot:Em0006g993a
MEAVQGLRKARFERETWTYFALLYLHNGRESYLDFEPLGVLCLVTSARSKEHPEAFSSALLLLKCEPFESLYRVASTYADDIKKSDLPVSEQSNVEEEEADSEELETSEPGNKRVRLVSPLNELSPRQTRRRTDDLFSALREEAMKQHITTTQLLGYLLHRENYVHDRPVADIGMKLFQQEPVAKELSLDEALYMLSAYKLGCSGYTNLSPDAARPIMITLGKENSELLAKIVPPIDVEIGELQQNGVTVEDNADEAVSPDQIKDGFEIGNVDIATLNAFWKEDQKQKTKKKEAKKRIIAMIKAKTGIAVDMPDVVEAGGTSTTGNTARALLFDPEKRQVLIECIPQKEWEHYQKNP